jgi:hypothetical protein
MKAKEGQVKQETSGTLNDDHFEDEDDLRRKARREKRKRDRSNLEGFFG